MVIFGICFCFLVRKIDEMKQNEAHWWAVTDLIAMATTSASVTTASCAGNNQCSRAGYHHNFGSSKCGGNNQCSRAGYCHNFWQQQPCGANNQCSKAHYSDNFNNIRWCCND